MTDWTEAGYTNYLLIPEPMHRLLCTYVESYGPGVEWEKDLRMLNVEEGLLWMAKHNMAISGLELFQSPGIQAALEKLVKQGKIVEKKNINEDATILGIPE